MCMKAGNGVKDFRSLCQNKVISTQDEYDHTIYIDWSTADSHANDDYGDRASLPGWPDRCAAAICIGEFHYFQNNDVENVVQRALGSKYAFFDNFNGGHNALFPSYQMDARLKEGNPNLQHTKHGYGFNFLDNLKLCHEHGMMQGVCWLDIEETVPPSPGEDPSNLPLGRSHRAANNARLLRATNWPVSRF